MKEVGAVPVRFFALGMRLAQQEHRCCLCTVAAKVRGSRAKTDPYQPAEVIHMLGTILLIVLILLLIGAFPSWPHSRSWGYGPTGGLGVVLIVVIVLLVAGVI
jgi:hypothetical protein